MFPGGYTQHQLVTLLLTCYAASLQMQDQRMHAYLRHQALVYWDLFGRKSQKCWVGDGAGDQQ